MVIVPISEGPTALIVSEGVGGAEGDTVLIDTEEPPPPRLEDEKPLALIPLVAEEKPKVELGAVFGFGGDVIFIAFAVGVLFDDVDLETIAFDRTFPAPF